MLVRISDLRQYAYCPRIVYYSTCLPDVRPVTYTMEAGQRAHREEGGREVRRSLRPYGLRDGERLFDVDLEDTELGLRGRVDMVVVRADEVIPVEYKHTPGRLHHGMVLQLAAYGLLLARRFARPARRGFFYYILARRSREIPLDEALFTEVRQTVEAIRTLAEHEQMPPPPRDRRRCQICEFARFCNDVV